MEGNVRCGGMRSHGEARVKIFQGLQCSLKRSFPTDVSQRGFRRPRSQLPHPLGNQAESGAEDLAIYVRVLYACYHFLRVPLFEKGWEALFYLCSSQK